jgi:hypothetical protein
MADKPTLVDLRAEAKKDLAEWYNKTVVQPFIETGRSLGLTDDEINIAFNVVMYGCMAWNEKPY